ncbi:hypothetical protein AB4305_13890 [Nocardia sp. 2YAB30]
MIAATRPDRRIHVVADGAYECSTRRHLPVNMTLTGPLPRNAALYEVHPDVDNPPPCAAGGTGRALAAPGSAHRPTWPPPPWASPSR